MKKFSHPFPIKIDINSRTGFSNTAKYWEALLTKEKRLLEELDSPAFQDSGLKSQIIDFLNQIDREIPIHKEAKRVAILYTGLGGGGHKAPAIAMKDKLIREKYTVEMIDVEW